MPVFAEIENVSLLLENLFDAFRIMYYLAILFSQLSHSIDSGLCSMLRFSLHLLFDVYTLAKVAFHGSKAIVQY